MEYGIDRGDLPADLDVEMAASMLDWMAGGFQGRAGEQGPRPGPAASIQEETRALRIEQFVDLLPRSLGTAP